jgi:hypothetical protein
MPHRREASMKKPGLWAQAVSRARQISLVCSCQRRHHAVNTIRDSFSHDPSADDAGWTLPSSANHGVAIMPSGGAIGIVKARHRERRFDLKTIAGRSSIWTVRFWIQTRWLRQSEEITNNVTYANIPVPG